MALSNETAGGHSGAIGFPINVYEGDILLRLVLRHDAVEFTSFSTPWLGHTAAVYETNG